MIGRYFEEFTVGSEIVSAGQTLTLESMIAFATLYDPQDFHIDVEASKSSPYGGLIASGFQTLSVGFRMFIDTGVLAGTSFGSPAMIGLDACSKGRRMFSPKLFAAPAPSCAAHDRARDRSAPVGVEARPRHRARRVPRSEPARYRRADLFDDGLRQTPSGLTASRLCGANDTHAWLPPNARGVT